MAMTLLSQRWICSRVIQSYVSPRGTLLKRMQAKRSCLSLHPACGGRPHCNLYSRGLASIFENIGALLLFNLGNVFVVYAVMYLAGGSSMWLGRTRAHGSQNHASRDHPPSECLAAHIACVVAFSVLWCRCGCFCIC